MFFPFPCARCELPLSLSLCQNEHTAQEQVADDALSRDMRTTERSDLVKYLLWLMTHYVRLFGARSTSP